MCSQFMRYLLLSNICFTTHTLPRECIAIPRSHGFSYQIHRWSAGGNHNKIFLFFTNTTRGQSWIELSAWRDFQNHFHPLSFSFIHTTHKQLQMEKCCNCLWFVWCIHHAKNDCNWLCTAFQLEYFLILS